MTTTMMMALDIPKYMSSHLRRLNKDEIPLPSEYKRLKYLESTGTQYIDTLWHPQSNNLRVKFKVKSKGTPRSTAICGAANSSIVPRWVFVMFGQAAEKWRCRICRRRIYIH